MARGTRSGKEEGRGGEKLARATRPTMRKRTKQRSETRRRGKERSRYNYQADAVDTSAARARCTAPVAASAANPSAPNRASKERAFARIILMPRPS